VSRIDEADQANGGDTAGGSTAGAGAFDAFYLASAPEAIGLAALLVSSPEDAQDLVQEAFAGLLQRWELIDNPGGYLRRSIVNGASNTYRRRARGRFRIEVLSRAEMTRAEPALDYLADQIEALPPKQRVVIVLKFYLQLRDKEIAEATGMRPGSVGPTLNRAIRRLRTEMHDAPR